MIAMVEEPAVWVDQVRADVPAKPAATVIVVCAWCKCWMGGAPLDSGVPVSHGLCLPCKAEALGELKEEGKGS